MEKKFKREIDSLDEIFQFVKECMVAYKIDDSFSFSLNFILEELFTNIVKYSTTSFNDVLIDLKTDDDKLIINIIDFGGKPFDLTKAKDVDTTLSIEERKVGGLGVHLVKKMTEDVKYEYKDNQGKITIIMNLEN